MKYKNLMDLHCHSDNSPDGEHSTILMCEYAQRAMIRALAFTDHCEVDEYYDNNYDRRIKQSFFEANKARAVFTGKMIVSIGVELGQPCHDIETAEKILDEYDFDIVLGSVHKIRGGEDIYFVDFNDVNIKEFLEKYFVETYELVKWDGIDVLAHLTYPLRYINGREKLDYDVAYHDDVIDEILRIIAQTGKALEINTGGLRAEIREPSPSLKYVKRFKELGGEYITVGDDSHKVSDLGSGLANGIDLASEAGFKYLTLYESRTPVPIPIE